MRHALQHDLLVVVHVLATALGRRHAQVLVPGAKDGEHGHLGVGGLHGNVAVLNNVAVVVDWTGESG